MILRDVNVLIYAHREDASAEHEAYAAWHAALAIECGCQWISTDCDFARFPGLDWRHPLKG